MDSSFVVFLVPALVLGGVLGIYFLFEANHRRRCRWLQRLADLLHEGEPQFPRSPFDPMTQAKVYGRVQDRRVRVGFDLVGTGDHRQTVIQFRMEVPNAVAAFSVRPGTVLNRVGRFLGLVEHTSIGDASIEQKFILKGSARSLRELFRQSPKLEWCFEDLFKRKVKELELRRGELFCQFTFDHLFASPRQIHGVILTLSRIAACCERVAVPEVQLRILGERKAFAWTGGARQPHCPFCRETLEVSAPDVGACPECGTLHHEECLGEAGGCTVFGCQNSAAGRRVRNR